ncbi:hypothetical protein N665_0339s0027 [Sinapis alba]|nr:hypothetical protein N665_0339s0027 [Sinapis alba]
MKALLPERLFATNRFPSERVNIYSTVEYLLRVKEALKGTPEMEVLAGFSFGGLFKIPEWRLLAGKVIHSMLTRQLVKKKKYEMWPVFGGKPLRFSLVEFGEVTGLHSPELTVKPILDISMEHEEMWGVWDEEKYDKKVDYMLRLMNEGHMFSKSDWGGMAETCYMFITWNRGKRKKELMLVGGATVNQ